MAKNKGSHNTQNNKGGSNHTGNKQTDNKKGGDNKTDTGATTTDNSMQ